MLTSLQKEVNTHDTLSELTAKVFTIYLYMENKERDL